LLQPFEEGGSAGYVPPFEDMLAAYYKARGWDPETGKPKAETLASLGLEETRRELWLQGDHSAPEG
jgi:aldehyde:ferredoxin oxidoreductase